MRVVRAVVGVVGELMITAGVIVLLFVVWQLGVVAVVTNRAQADTVAGLEGQFAAPHPSASAQPTTSPTSQPTTPQDGAAFAVLRIPRLGDGWAKPIYQGVGLDVLAQGIGHYPETQLPGQVGNVGLAGHRAGHGNPLIDIDAIRQGDRIIVETATAYDVYTVARYQIVPPTQIQVIAPVPDQPGVAPTEQWLTLTSCDPRFASTNRYIVYAKLSQSIPHDQGLPAEALAPVGSGA